MKYMTFVMDGGYASYCINVENIQAVVRSSDIVVRPNKLGDGINALAIYLGETIRVLDSVMAFECGKKEDFGVMILVYTAKGKLFVPVSRINEIIETDNIRYSNAPSERIRFVIFEEERMYLLIEDCFYANMSTRTGQRVL